MQELIDGEPPDFTRFLTFRSGVVDHVFRSTGRDLTSSQEDHAMESDRICCTPVKQNISGLSVSDFARNKKCIPALQSIRIGEFSERPGMQIRERPRTDANAEKRRAQQRVRILVFANRLKCWHQCELRCGRPFRIVLPQSFAIRIPQQRGAIGDFSRTFGWRRKVLNLCKKCEPAAKGFLIGTIVQTQEIWRAIAISVGQFKARILSRWRCALVAGQIPF